MQRRPHRDTRRGLFRAALVVIGLIALSLALLLIVSSLTASTVKAPSVPSTPTPGKKGTPVTTPSGTRTPGTPTNGKKTKTSMTSGRSLADRVLSNKPALPAGTAVAPNGRFAVFFRTVGDAYVRNPLMLRDMRTGRSSQIGYGDPLVQPVWSPQSTSIMYVHVTSTRRFPGALWTLLKTDIMGETKVLTSARALNLQPLGWNGGHALYLVATASDTSVESISHKRPSLVSILLPQVVTTAVLSPDGNSIGYTVPTGCGYCTTDIFDLKTLRTSYGPSSFGGARDLAWTADSRTLVTHSAHGLALMDRARGSVRVVPNPRALPLEWPHSMRARLGGDLVELIDRASGTIYKSSFRA